MTSDPSVAQTPGQAAEQPPISLLSRPGCHLCEEAREVVARVARELGVAWTERDVTASAEDMRQYADMVPVVFVAGVQHDFWRVDEARLRKALGQ